MSLFGMMWQHRFLQVLMVLAVIGSAGFAEAGTKVTINDDGLLVIDGRTVFPIGFSNAPEPGAKTPAGKSGLQELRDAGGTWFRIGLGETNWYEQESIDRELGRLNAAAEHGLYCWVNLQELSCVAAGQDKKVEQLKKTINRFKDHPGLLIWKNSDEVAWANEPAENMIRGYKIIHETDPDHPVVQTHAPRGTIESLRPYNGCADIFNLDIYPIGYPDGKHSLWPNKDISMVGDYTRFLHEVVEHKKPCWMTLQICWSGVVKEGKTLRFPTFPQERFMVYQAIINGARGLNFFGGHVIPGLTDEDKALGWNWRFWQRVLLPVLEEINEKSPLAKALIAPESKLPIKLTGATDIEYCVREAGNELFILACKRDASTLKVEFSGLPEWVSQGDVLYEPPRKVQASGGKFTDWFAQHEVHVYRFKK